MTDYQKLRELAQAATPGPWQYMPRHGYGPVVLDGHHDPVFDADGGDYSTFLDCEDSDAQFIAAANPDVILNLLEDLRITRAERDAEKHKNLALRKGQGTYHQENK